MSSPFLTAEWRRLIMANYVLAPELLADYLPAGTELDLFHGQCFVSLIGFYFQNVRLKGFRIPFHANFEEVNLRFYVRRILPTGEARRGVVFIRELVPLHAISIVANTLYGERYAVAPMKLLWSENDGALQTGYRWKSHGHWHSMEATSERGLVSIEPGSVQEFITEHYWGYAKKRGGRTMEYAVQHPRWQQYVLRSFSTDADFGALYGERFAPLTGREPDNVILAEGSAIAILHGQTLG
ncbi:YqjF family protein [Terriglobus saanensis]|uniref:DUF2071 domain-containing protein n=1 Tax=Terriglobus saanensis (strain ATCC BAA-1853 / DSM 23119 / SP1PR4) TaxID=401053 RepID=E8UY17_TERSS|nr:DUF2071 domain-containing protein [Terriglobus saanensis]ADV84251.1 hypothetical protein AciPR4_3498 [Terriglobus saanensis SP1PR4]